MPEILNHSTLRWLEILHLRLLYLLIPESWKHVRAKDIGHIFFAVGLGLAEGGAGDGLLVLVWLAVEAEALVADGAGLLWALAMDFDGVHTLPPLITSTLIPIHLFLLFFLIPSMMRIFMTPIAIKIAAVLVIQEIIVQDVG